MPSWPFSGKASGMVQSARKKNLLDRTCKHFPWSKLQPGRSRKCCWENIVESLWRRWGNAKYSGLLKSAKVNPFLHRGYKIAFLEDLPLDAKINVVENPCDWRRVTSEQGLPVTMYPLLTPCFRMVVCKCLGSCPCGKAWLKCTILRSFCQRRRCNVTPIVQDE